MLASRKTTKLSDIVIHSTGGLAVARFVYYISSLGGHMIDPSLLFYEVTNALLTASWLGIAAMLWRVRHLKLLDGGCPVIVITLIAYALTRAAIMCGYQPWNIPLIMAITAGLTITSAAIIMTVLYKLAKDNPAPPDDSPPALFKCLTPEAVKVYAEIKNGDKSWGQS